MNILVTGATGYIGGRLVPLLLSAGHRVRVLVRDIDPIKGRPWEFDVEVVHGDLLKPDTLLPAVRGVDAAYYLVHSMYGGDDFAQRDRDAARNFVDACNAAAAQDAPDGNGPEHVVYLGGLEPKDAETRSDHLRSRAEVGQMFGRGGDAGPDRRHHESPAVVSGDRPDHLPRSGPAGAYQDRAGRGRDALEQRGGR
ncbi:MAG: NAD(P)H-binding protein, partial [Planctomycetota bacterium]